jgi:predicted nucleic acid-binding protein
VNLVVDTNIVFSTLLNPKSPIGEILMNVQDEFTFFAPELLLKEIEKYSAKIEKYTKLNYNELATLKTLITNSIVFVSEDIISEKSWKIAYSLVKEIDEYDTPFVALSLEIAAPLWTGDKKLFNGLISTNNGLAISTEKLKKYLKNY